MAFVSSHIEAFAQVATDQEVYLPADKLIRVSKPSLQSDRDLVESIEKTLARVQLLRQAVLPRLTIEARDGVVSLSGNLINRSQRRRVEALTKLTPGTLRVRSEIVSDDDLEQAAALALAKDHLTRSDFIQVGSFFGLVYLTGATRPLAARSIVEGIPGVVSVILGPRPHN